MAKVLQRWMPNTLEELKAGLEEISIDTQAWGARDDTVYVEASYLSLEEETLTDGSRGLNLVIKESR
jgi:hypothetical protein